MCLKPTWSSYVNNQHIIILSNVCSPSSFRTRGCGWGCRGSRGSREAVDGWADISLGRLVVGSAIQQRQRAGQPLHHPYQAGRGDRLEGQLRFCRGNEEQRNALQSDGPVSIHDIQLSRDSRQCEGEIKTQPRVFLRVHAQRKWVSQTNYESPRGKNMESWCYRVDYKKCESTLARLFCGENSKTAGGDSCIMRCKLLKLQRNETFYLPWGHAGANCVLDSSFSNLLCVSKSSIPSMEKVGTKTRREKDILVPLIVQLPISPKNSIPISISIHGF